MGQFIQDIKVICDKDNGQDARFKFKVMVKNTEDLIETVNEGLLQKIQEGELDTQNLRSVIIESNDKLGFFSSITGDVKSILSRL